MDLKSKPYYDDYDSRKNFSEILFKPGFAVQARELNQLQTLLQEQIRRFGDNILKNGTIVSGGQITHHTSLPYVKIKDNNVAASAVDVASLFNKHVTNAAGTKALIVTSTSGQESAAPDLKTIFVKYLNAGNSGTALTFAANEVLTVTDPITAATLMQITVAGAPTSPIGSGYGLTIEEGVVYHAGYFTRTLKQLVVVSKYTNTPDAITVGFNTAFDVVTADDDASLLDNAQGYPNANAPGADRLRANASAIVLSKSDAVVRSDFLAIVEFTNGEPYKQDPNTQYNVIDQTLARRTHEESGNYVIDRFNVNTKSSTIANEPSTFQIVIDPGVAYLKGYRVATDRNFTTTINKATATKNVASVSSAVDYGSYIIVNRLNGDVSALIGSQVNLNDTVQSFAIGGGVSIAGGTIGNARVRAVKWESRALGTLRIYLFDIKLNAGYSFLKVLSVNATNFSANLNGTPKVVDPARSTAIFSGPVNAIKAISNVVFTQQKSDWGTVNSTTGGAVSLTVSGSDQFEVSGTLSRSILDSLIITPNANTIATTAKTGTVATTSGSNVVSGTSTVFTTEVRQGQWLDIGGAEKVQISAITNNTSLMISANSGITASAQTLKSFYPKYDPLYILSGSVSGQTMSLNVMEAVPATGITAIVPVRKVAAPASKSVTRNAVCRIKCDTNVAGVAGPWCLGLPDIIHLRGVYKGTSTTFSTGTAGVVNVTNDFYLDSNHATDSIGLGYLFKRPTSTLALASTDRLLVVFDVLTTTGTNYRTIGSYPINDGVTLAASAATMNTLELPEVFGAQDSYYDVRDSIDFRPIYVNTISVATTQSTAAIDPSESVYGSRYSTIGMFPAPESTITCGVEYYLPRSDRVVVNTSGDFVNIAGQPGVTTPPLEPADVITINNLNIPPYPSLPFAMSDDLVAFADTKLSNEKISKRRIARFSITTLLNSEEINNEQPRGYRMKDIGDMDRRLLNVEYYLGLTMSEQQAQTRKIPSNADSNTDRFKFGFFVDSFSDSSLSDTSNPQYSASIAEGSLRPTVENVVVHLDPQEGLTSGGITSLAFTDYVLVSQTGATTGPIVPAPVPVPTSGGTVVIAPPPPPIDVITPPPVVVPVTVINQIQTSVTVKNQNVLMSTIGNAYEEKEFYLSSTSGSAAIYFNTFDNDIAIEVYQGDVSGFTPGVPVKDGLNAVDIIAGDKTVLAAGLGLPGALYSLDHYAAINGHNVVEDFGKILWTYNPAAGRYIKIRIYKFRGQGSVGGYQVPGTQGQFAYRFFFPIDETTTINPVSVPSSFAFNGVVGTVSPSVFTVGSQVGSAGVTQYYTLAQKFRITATGLKPNTLHQFWFEGVDATANCVPVTGTTMVTSSYGTIAFDYSYGGVPATTTYTATNVANNAVPGTKTFEIKLADGSSSAVGYISAPNYATGGLYNVYDPIVHYGIVGTLSTSNKYFSPTDIV